MSVGRAWDTVFLCGRRPAPHMISSCRSSLVTSGMQQWRALIPPEHQHGWPSGTHASHYTAGTDDTIFLQDNACIPVELLLAAGTRHGTGVAGEFGFGASSSSSQYPRTNTRHGPIITHAIQAQLHVPWASRPDSIYSAAALERLVFTTSFE